MLATSVSVTIIAVVCWRPSNVWRENRAFVLRMVASAVESVKSRVTLFNYVIKVPSYDSKDLLSCSSAVERVKFKDLWDAISSSNSLLD